MKSTLCTSTSEAFVDPKPSTSPNSFTMAILLKEHRYDEAESVMFPA
jgi:hypothetical protein